MQPARSEFCLTFLSGANAGAVVPLPAGRTVIGGDAADAIVLDGALPAQLTVTVQGERVRLDAAASGVAVGDGLEPVQTLRPGQPRILPLPVMVRMNDESVLNIARRAPMQGRVVSAAVAGLATVAALAGGLLVGLQMPDSVRAASEMTAQAAAPPAASQPALAATVPPRQPTAPLRATSPQLGPCDAACRADAVARLGSQMQAAGLESLKLSAEGDVLRVSGSVTPEQEQRWRTVRRDFETTYGGSLPLLVNLGAGAGQPVLAVSSIWLGPRPELRTRDGKTLRIGDSTGDGWTVKAIARGAVTLARDGAETVVRF